MDVDPARSRVDAAGWQEDETRREYTVGAAQVARPLAARARRESARARQRVMERHEIPRQLSLRKGGVRCGAADRQRTLVQLLDLLTTRIAAGIRASGESVAVDARE